MQHKSATHSVTSLLRAGCTKAQQYYSSRNQNYKLETLNFSIFAPHLYYEAKLMKASKITGLRSRMAEARTVAFHTLGCKLNFSETSTLSRMLENEGFEKKEFDDQADVYVINTCSVTDNADKECRQIVRRILRKAPESLVVITGCYAQLKPKQIAEIPGVSLVLGAAEKFNLVQHIRELSKGDSAKICSCDIEEVTGFNSSFSINDRTRTFLKVQDGCDYNCSFCTIPRARGKSRSDSIENVIKNVEHLASHGVKEYESEA